MASDLFIQLGAKLDESQEAVSRLNNQIKNISTQLNSIGIKLEFDTTVFDTKIKEAQEKLKDTFGTVNLNVNANTSGISNGGNIGVNTEQIAKAKEYASNIGQVTRDIQTNISELDGKILDCTTKVNEQNGALSATVKYYDEQGKVVSQILTCNSDLSKWSSVQTTNVQKEATEQEKLNTIIQKRSSDLQDTLLSQQQLTNATKEMNEVAQNDSLDFEQKKVAIGEVVGKYKEINAELINEQNQQKSINELIEKKQSALKQMKELSSVNINDATKEINDVSTNDSLSLNQKKIAIDEIVNKYREINSQLSQEQNQQKAINELVERKQSALNQMKELNSVDLDKATLEIDNVVGDSQKTLNQKKIAIDEIVNKYREQNTILKTTRELEDKIADADKRYQENIKQSNLSIKKRNELEQKYNQIVNSNASSKEKLEALRRLNTEINITAKNTKSLGYMLQTAAQKFTVWMSITNLFYQAARAVKDMTKIVFELDSALTELRKVTDASEKDLKNYTNRAFDASTALGRTGQEVIEATSEWARAGYTLEESFSLAKTSLLFTNIADGIDSVTEASSALISVMAGFNLGDSDATKIVDIINEVSNTNPIDSSNITTALKTIAGTAAQAGNSLEETTAMITAAFKSLRNSGKVATGLNFVFMNLQGLDENGDAVEGLTAKYQKLFDTYTDGQVQITDENGTLRSSWDILNDLSEVWDTLGKNVQAYIAQEVAGKRQAKTLLALMQNWDTAKSALQSGLNSTGSANRENLVYLDSLNGKLSVLKSNYQKLAQVSVDNEFIKFWIDVANGVLKTSTYLGGLVPVLGVLVGLLLQIKSKPLGALAQGIAEKLSKVPSLLDLLKNRLSSLNAIKLFNVASSKKMAAAQAQENLEKEKSVLASLQEKLANAQGTQAKVLKKKVTQQATVVQNAETVATKSATVATEAYGLALKSVFGIIGLVVTAISLVSMGVSAYNQSLEENEQKAQEFNNKQKELANSLKDCITQYEELSKAKGELDSDDVDGLVEKNNELSNVQAQLVELLGSQADGIDLVNGKYDEELDKLKAIYLQKVKNQLDSNRANAITADDEYQKAGSQEGFARGWSSTKQAFSALSGSSILSQVRDAMGQDKWSEQTLYDELAGTDIDGRITKLKEWRNALIEANNEGKDVAKALSWVESVLGECETAQDNYNKAISDTANSYAILEWYSKFGDITVNTAEDYERLINKIKGAKFDSSELNYYGIEAEDVQAVLLDLAKKTYPELNAAINNCNDSTMLSQESLKTMKDNVSSTISSIKTLSSAMKEMSENGELSAETAIKLIDAGYAGALSYDKNTGAIKLNNEALKNLYKTKLATQKLDAKSKLADATEGLKNQIPMFEDLIKIYGSAKEAVRAYMSGLSDSQKSNFMSGEFYNTWLQANNLVQVLDTLSQSADSDILGEFENGLNSIKTSANNAVSALDKLSSALEEQNENGSLSLKTTLDLIENGYAASLSIDAETGAVTLNKQAYIDLAKAKLIAAQQEAAMEREKAIQAIQEETGMTREQTEAYLQNAKAKMADGLVGAYTKKVINEDKTVNVTTKTHANQVRFDKDARPPQYTEEEWADICAGQDIKTYAEQEIDVTQKVKTVIDAEATEKALQAAINNIDNLMSNSTYDSSDPTDTKANEEKAEQDYYKTLADEASARQSAYDKMYDAERMTIEDYYNAIAKLQSDGMFNVIKSMSSDELTSLLSLTDSKFSGLKSLAEEYIDLTKKLDELSVDKLTESYEKLTDQIAKYGDLISSLGDIDTPEERSAQASYLASQYELICDDIIDLNKQLQETDLSLEKQKTIQKQINELTKQKVDIEDKIKDMARDYLEQEKENKLLAVEIAQKTKLLNLEKEIYGDQGKTGYEHQKQQEIDAIQKQIDALNEQKDAQDRVNEGKELEAKLTQLQLDLVNEMNNKTTKVLTKQADGSWQFEYSANLEKIKEIQENISETKKEQLEYGFDSEIQKLEDKIKALEDEQEQKSNAYEDIKYYIDLQAEQDKARIESEYALIDTKVEEIYNGIMDSSNALSEELAKLAQSYNDALNQNEQLTALDKSNDLIASKLNDLDVWFRQLVDTDTTNAQEMIDAYNSVTEETLEPINDSIGEIVDSANNILEQLSNGGLSAQIDVSGITGLDILSSSEKFDSLVDYIKGQSELGLLGSTINISKIEFPNVQSDIKEIQNAILDLPNVALQRAKQQ